MNFISATKGSQNNHLVVCTDKKYISEKQLENNKKNY